MKNTAKMLIFVWAIMGVTFSGINSVIAKDRPPRQEKEVDALTDEQVKTVKTILSDYDSDALTATDAKAIHEAFREAKIPGGKALDSAVDDAGFDSKKLRELDPPPDRPERQGRGRR